MRALVPKSVFLMHRPASSQNQLWILFDNNEFRKVLGILKKKQTQLNGKCPSLSG